MASLGDPRDMANSDPLWPVTDIAWPAPVDHVSKTPVRLTLEEFERLPIASGCSFASYRTYRCLYRGRFHTVWRQFNFGQAVTYYHPVILTTASQSETICI